MADLAKQLVEAVEKAFTRNCKTDIVVSGIERTLKKNGVSYREAEEYSARLGELLAQAYKETITPDMLPNGKLDADLAEELMRTLLSQNYERAAEVAARVQTSLNRSAGLGIKGLQPAVNEDRLDGLINKAASYESYDKAAWVLNEPVVNYTQSAVEDTIRKNADAHFNAGLHPKIRRISVSGCCKWCNRLAGVYAYPVKREIYKRHERCRCLVLYDPGDGKIQDAHTKVIYQGRLQKAAKEARDARIEKATFQSGAQSGAKKTEGWEERHAERYYEEIRNRAPYSDANKISKNISEFNAEQVEEIRQHMFIRNQPRDGGLKRFDPDFDQAQAWQRLVEGKNIWESDIVMLQHEFTELSIMRETGCAYEKAHDLANQSFDWFEAFNEEKERRGKQ